jgi:predicted DNA binding protein/PAS domain-containing protein
LAFDTWQYHPAQLFFHLSGLLSLILFWYTLVKIRQQGRLPALVIGSLLSICNLVWAFAASLKIASVTLPMKYLFYKVELIGSAPIPSLILLLVIMYINPNLLSRRISVTLTVIPLIIIPLAWFNPGEILLQNPVIIDLDGYLTLEHEYTPVTSLYLTWVLFAPLAAAAMLITTPRSGVTWRYQVLLSAGILIPITVLFMKVADIYPSSGVGINLTPAIGGICFVGMAFLVYKANIFNLLSVARSHIIEQAPGGFIITNSNGRIIDLNQPAVRLLTSKKNDALGKKFTNVVPYESCINKTDHNIDGSCRFKINGSVINMDVTTFDTRSGHSGKIAILTDVSHLEMMKSKNRDQVNLLISEKPFRSTAEDACEILVDKYGFSSVWIWTEPPKSGDLPLENAIAMYGDRDFEVPVDTIYRTHQTLCSSPSSITVEENVCLQEYSDTFTVRSVKMTNENAVFGIITTIEKQNEKMDGSQLLNEFGMILGEKFHLSLLNDISISDSVVRVMLDVRPGRSSLPIIDKVQDIEQSGREYSAIYHLPSRDESATTVILGTNHAADNSNGVETQGTGSEDKAGGTESLRSNNNSRSAANSNTTNSSDQSPTVVRITSHTPIHVLTDHAAFIETTTVDANHLLIEATFSRRANISQVIDDLSERWKVTLRSKETVENVVESPKLGDYKYLSDVETQALITAIHLGFFERPQKATGQEVAEALGVSRSTFMRRVRSAERGLFKQVFDDNSIQSE